MNVFLISVLVSVGQFLLIIAKCVESETNFINGSNEVMDTNLNVSSAFKQLSQKLGQQDATCTNMTRKQEKLQQSVDSVLEILKDVKKKLLNAEDDNRFPSESAPDFKFVGHLNGHDYYLNFRKRSLADAEAECVQFGGHLASVADETEGSFIRDTFVHAYGKNHYWLGGMKAAGSSSFLWFDGTPFHYTNWRKTGLFHHEPDIEVTNCAGIADSEKWYDEPCSKAYHSACQKRSGNRTDKSRSVLNNTTANSASVQLAANTGNTEAIQPNLTQVFSAIQQIIQRFDQQDAILKVVTTKQESTDSVVKAIGEKLKIQSNGTN